MAKPLTKTQKIWISRALFVWLMRVGVADLLCEKSIGCWFVLREKYYWLVADKPNEQGVGI
jgi:hypothetical protein